jgi:hypothetical protein
LQVIKLSIHPSSVGIDAGSDAGESFEGSGALPTSSILVSMVLSVVLGGVVGWWELRYDDKGPI